MAIIDRAIRLVSVLLLSVTIGDFANAAVTTEERYQYYDVSGNSTYELRASINRQRDALGKRFDALTTWNIRWEFSFVARPQKCKITNVSIMAIITYLLPRWPDAEQHTNESLVTSWQRYNKQLTAHEHHHGRLVKAAVLDVERAIHRSDDTSSAPSTCAALETLANNNAQAVMQQLDKQQKQFDVVTDHGRTTGAQFP